MQDRPISDDPQERAALAPKPATVEDVLQDAANTNRHTEAGMGMLEDVLRTYGAGRSILLDADNRIIAGSGVLESAYNAGLVKLRVVDTNGQELVAVRRTDVRLDTPMGRALHVADNTLPQANQDLDWEMIQDQAHHHGLDLKPLGVPDDLLTRKLREAAQQAAASGPGTDGGTDQGAPAVDRMKAEAGQAAVVIVCETVDQQRQLFRDFQAQGLDVRRGQLVDGTVQRLTL